MSNFRTIWDDITEDWNEYQLNAHPDDQMTLTEYAQALVGTVYNGHTITADWSGNIGINKVYNVNKFFEDEL